MCLHDRARRLPGDHLRSFLAFVMLQLQAAGQPVPEVVMEELPERVRGAADFGSGPFLGDPSW